MGLRIVAAIYNNKYVEVSRMPVAWTDELKVGVKSIDDQHMHLVDLINDFSRAVSQGRGAETYADLADDLANYAKVHFDDEEGLMLRHRFDGYAEHGNEHTQFVILILMMITKPKDSENSPESVAEFLENWIVEHIMKCDKELGVYLNKKGVV